MTQTYLQKILTEYLKGENLKDERGKSKLIRYEYWLHEPVQTGTEDTLPKKVVNNIGRPYVFKRADFVMPDDEDRGELPF